MLRAFVVIGPYGNFFRSASIAAAVHDWMQFRGKIVFSNQLKSWSDWKDYQLITIWSFGWNNLQINIIRQEIGFSFHLHAFMYVMCADIVMETIENIKRPCQRNSLHVFCIIKKSSIVHQWRVNQSLIKFNWNVVTIVSIGLRAFRFVV